MNKGILILIALTAGFCACSKDEDDSQPQRRISIEVTENPLVSNEGSGSAVSTRGSVINTSSLTAFSMNYQTTQYDISKSGNVWTPDPINWPLPYEYDNTPITFRAYNGGSYQYSGDYVNFTVDETASNQKDLLVATNTVSYNDANGKVSLAFDHACAAVDFRVCLTTTLHGNLGGLTINSIQLVNVKNTGKYYYAEGWKELDGSATYTLTAGPISVGTTPQALYCGTLFMIPQTLAEGARLIINYTLDEQNKSVLISLKDWQWVAGHQYLANIRLGTNQIN